MSQVFLYGVGGGRLPEGYLKPEGTASISENGEYDITEYANVFVNVEKSEIEAPDPDDWNSVHFYDYDGSLLYVIPLADVPNLTELPPLPMHEGLVCQGWNWTLEDIQSWDIPLDVGAMYITDDGATRIVVDLQDEFFLECSFKLYFTNIIVDWGDGSEPETYSNGSATYANTVITHNYAALGRYCVSIYVTEDDILEFQCRPFWETATIGCISEIYGGKNFNFGIPNSYNTYSLGSLRKITLPTSVTVIPSYAFKYSSLSCIIIPNSVVSFENGREQFAHSPLTCISFPNNELSLPYYCFVQTLLERLCLPNVTCGSSGVCYDARHLKFLSKGNDSFGSYDSHNGNSKLKRIVFSDRIETINMGHGNNWGHFSGCGTLKYVNFPPISHVGRYDFKSCSRLEKLTFAPVVGDIKYTFCEYCRSLKTFDFSLTESVPNLTVTNAFATGLPTDYEILIPARLYFDWTEATNWSAVADHIRAVGGAGLRNPTEQLMLFDSTINISLDWIHSDGLTPSSFNVTADIPGVVTISNESITDSNISFDILTLQTEATVNLTISMEIGEEIVTKNMLVYVFETIPAPTYRVENLEKTSNGYDFALNDAGYYESTNQGVAYSYSWCKVVFSTWNTHKLIFDCINYGQNYNDYGILSKVDSELTPNYYAVSTDPVYKSFQSQCSSSVVSVDYGSPGLGEHFVYIKYIKNGSTNSNNDSLQFQVRFEAI